MRTASEGSMATGPSPPPPAVAAAVERWQLLKEQGKLEEVEEEEEEDIYTEARMDAVRKSLLPPPFIPPSLPLSSPAKF